MNREARYISLTGMDATGKSTLIRQLSVYLSAKGIDHITVREPGGNTTAEAIRSTMFAHQMEPKTDALMMAAARSELIAKTVKPALEVGLWVISDRSVACSATYQGHIGGLGIPKVIELNQQFALHDCVPDLEFFLNAETKIIKERMQQRGMENRFDKMDHDEVRKGYRSFYELNLYPHKEIDANGTPETTLEQVINALVSYIN